jgi:S-adenosylmethionine:tRNA-ribosyltransferase-isomerase (queuine synthetase)
MVAYVILATLWTLYMGFETYVFTRPQSRPHFVGFLMTHLLLAPLSFVISITSGILRERIEAAYRSARKSKETFHRTGRKKLIG